MNLFIFGLGYSARRFLATQGATLGLSAAGTVRGRDKARALQAEGIETYVFGPDAADAEIPAALAKADALLLTATAGAATCPNADGIERCEPAAQREAWRMLCPRAHTCGHAHHDRTSDQA